MATVVRLFNINGKVNCFCVFVMYVMHIKFACRLNVAQFNYAVSLKVQQSRQTAVAILKTCAHITVTDYL